MSLILSVLIVLQSFCAEDIPGNITDLNVCKISHMGLEYMGTVAKSESKVRCQAWAENEPHKTNENISDTDFPELNKKAVKNYCRNPTRDPKGPWCYTMNFDLSDETCALPLCSLTHCKITGPGMEYAGNSNRGASDKKCLKWNKVRNKVLYNGKPIKVPIFDNIFFPEQSAKDAGKLCRNPDGDIGGPWCLTEDDDADIIKKEYCDISFCDVPPCDVFTRNSNTYMHYTVFNDSLSIISFGIKAWEPDNYLNSTAKFVLSVLPLPLDAFGMDHMGTAIEIVISNQKGSALTVNNVDTVYFEATPNVIKSTEYTNFSLSWQRGFITLSLEERQSQSIFLAEFKHKDNLLGYYNDSFFYYSALGTNILWSFPFCKEDYDCDIHVTTGYEYQQFYPLRMANASYELPFFVRARHSGSLLFVPSPAVDFPQVEVLLKEKQTKKTYVFIKAYQGAPAMMVKELPPLHQFLSMWKYHEFNINFFANTMQFYWTKNTGTHSLFEIRNELFREIRWFSAASKNTQAYWTFFCAPSIFPPFATLPECSLMPDALNYKGTQDFTEEGLPCLPWTGENIANSVELKRFHDETALSAVNYCRNLYGNNEGAVCYAISLIPEKTIIKQKCKIRKCKSSECRMAGTGNDYSGPLNVTRSNRTCELWINPKPVHKHNVQYLNESLFPDLYLTDIKNNCRNPSRNVVGSWCYTNDSQVAQDLCSVKDCEKPEECTIIVSGPIQGREIFIMPQWKEFGINGGFQFSLKHWDPDLVDGMRLSFLSPTGTVFGKLEIGTENNQQIRYYYYDNLQKHKTLPHLLSAGSWTDFWLQIRQGELRLGYQGIPDALFEWKDKRGTHGEVPTYMAFGPLYGHHMGISFACDECHTENTTTDNWFKIMPIGLWSKDELNFYHNMTLNIQGTGLIHLPLTNLPLQGQYVLLEFDTFNNTINVYRINNYKSNKVANLILNNTLITQTNWTTLVLNFTEHQLNISQNDNVIFQYQTDEPMLLNFFSLGVEQGWVVWSVNCPILDIHGAPRDGGWSTWSPWVCTVSCGGGEGYRTRTCSNPRPNFKGKLCDGPSSSTGKCNDFECGDLSPYTIEKVRNKLRREHYGHVVNESEAVTIENDAEVLKLIDKESPDAYFEWTLNGLFVKPEEERISFKDDNIVIKRTQLSDAGVYVCVLYRVNKKRLIFRVISLAVVPKFITVDTRATLPLSINCNAVVLAYVYTDLSLKWMINDAVFKDFGTTMLAATNVFEIESLNESNTGLLKCVIEQKGLRFKWITSYLNVRVQKAPNLYTHLMEDRLTKPIFGWLGNENRVHYAIWVIVFGVALLVIIALVLYFRFCTLKRRNYKPAVKNRRFK